MDVPQTYEPSLSQQTQNPVYANHYKFKIDRLPDLSFFVQRVKMSDVSSTPAFQHNPFSVIPQTGDHLVYGTLDVDYTIDAGFKNYFSLYYWMKGYGFPHSFEEVETVRAEQSARYGLSRIRPTNIEKTSGLLQILTPDVASIVAEIRFENIFPISLGSLQWETINGDAPLVTTTCTFAVTTFDVKLL